MSRKQRNDPAVTFTTDQSDSFASKNFQRPFMALYELRKSCPLPLQPVLTREQQLPVLGPSNAVWQQQQQLRLFTPLKMLIGPITREPAENDVDRVGANKT